MSYILDALKESDQQRKQTGPTQAPPQRPQSLSPPPRKRRGLGVLLVLLVLLGFAGWHFGWFNQLRVPEPAGEPPVAAQLEPSSDSTTPSVTTSPAPAAPVATPKVERRIPTPSTGGQTASERLGDEALVGVKLVVEATPETAPAPRARAADAPAASPGVAASEPAPVTEAVAAPVTEVIAPDPYADLPYLRQLPVEVQRALPPLSFSVHIYSEQRSGRMVRINDRMVREGQRIAPDLQLEAIIPRGVVLTFKEHRFRVPSI